RGREDEVQRLLAEDARRPFALSQGPLLRVMVIKIHEAEHVVAVTLHHIVADGWSIGVWFREIVTLYGAFQSGRPSPLGELPVQYADYAVWRRQWLRGEALERPLRYWRERRRGASALELPPDRPRPPLPSFRGATHPLVVEGEVYEGLKELSRREGATLFMTLMAGFAVLLHRYTGQADICVGTPVANRTRSEVEGLIGFFVNTLVLRTDLGGSPSFVEVLRRVREAALEACAHQDLPFEKLVAELRPARDLSRNPLFQVMFVLQNAPMSAFKLPGLELKGLRIAETPSNFDLSLSLIDSDGKLRGGFEYPPELFD